MKGVAFVVFSHSSYSDIWEAYFGELEKYLPNVFGARYLFVDHDSRKLLADVPDDFKIVYYDESCPYSDRMLFCLRQIDEQVCLFQHEDMILCGEVDTDAIEKYLGVLREHNLDSIKLLKGGDTKDAPFEPHTGLFWAEEWFFAVQPSLWKVESLKKIFENFVGTNIWELEKSVQGFCKENDFRVLYSYKGESKRGRMHWDSSVFPFIATAICKGKWNTEEYSEELQEIFIEYGIDRLKRGFVS